MPIKKFLDVDKLEEHRRLYADFVEASRLAGEMLKLHGMDSKEFEAADYAAGEISSKINRLLGRHSWIG